MMHVPAYACTYTCMKIHMMLTCDMQVQLSDSSMQTVLEKVRKGKPRVQKSPKSIKPVMAGGNAADGKGSTKLSNSLKKLVRKSTT